jgi:hypothetical protein
MKSWTVRCAPALAMLPSAPRASVTARIGEISVRVLARLIRWRTDAPGAFRTREQACQPQQRWPNDIVGFMPDHRPAENLVWASLADCRPTTVGPVRHASAKPSPSCRSTGLGEVRPVDFRARTRPLRWGNFFWPISAVQFGPPWDIVGWVRLFLCLPLRITTATVAVGMWESRRLYGISKTCSWVE